MGDSPDVNRPAPAGGRVILRAFQPRPQVIEAGEPSGVTVTCDHAVFTSVRSPMGEGYQIAGASAGVKPQEKAEITRRSPSHRGLCSDSADAIGLIAFPLPTGRYCVARCSHAGAEHTARGGQRVFTHLAILDQAGMRAFSCNPVLVHASLGKPLELPKAVRGPAPLKPLALSIRDNLTTRPGLEKDDADRLLHMVASLLGEGRWIMHGVRGALTVLDWAFECVPQANRLGTCVSVGVRFAPARQTAVALIDGNSAEVERAIRGHAVQFADASTSLPGVAGRFDRWLELVREQGQGGRLPRLARLARQMSEPPPAETLNRIAILYTDRARVEYLDEEGLCRLQQCHSSATATYALEAEQRRRLLERIAERLSELSEEQVEKRLAR